MQIASLPPIRTPVMSAKKEKIAKFMCDLISDQEQRNQLLTEADYSASNITEQEISRLQPPSEAHIRALMLNEWNEESVPTPDSYSSDYEEESCSETNSCLSYDSAQKDSSFLSACWGNLSDSVISTTASSDFASLRASPVIEVLSTKGQKVKQEYRINNTIVSDTELESNLSSNHSVVTDSTTILTKKEILSDSVSSLVPLISSPLPNNIPEHRAQRIPWSVIIQ